MERRDLMKATVAGVAAAAINVPMDVVGQTSQGGQVKPTGPVTSKIAEHSDMKYRALGRTGERVSLVGMGGFHLAKPGGPSADEAVRIVHAGIDAGINFCDNCWDYNGGESEIRLGRALSGGWRNRTLLMTKIDGRTATAATSQIDESLKRLQTDHIDLLQFHEIIRMDDPERVFAQGGALEAVLRAREQGKIRYIGFTGHKSPAIHRHMFEVADQHGFHFDTVQMPLNVMDAHFRSFTHQVLPHLINEGIAPLAMKTFGGRAIAAHVMQTGTATPIELLHYSMSQPVSVVITGMEEMKLLDQALEAARTFAPMTIAQQTTLLDKMRVAAAKGDYEKFKTEAYFDGTAKNPQWLG